MSAPLTRWTLPTTPLMLTGLPLIAAFDPRTGITGPVTLPSGHTLDVDTAWTVREAYVLGHLVHQLETTAGRDQEAYLDCHSSQLIAFERAGARIASLFPDDADRHAILHTFTGPDSWGTSASTAMTLARRLRTTLGVALQAGYLVHLYATAVTDGLDPEVAWEYLALREHPTRMHAANFYFFDSTAI